MRFNDWSIIVVAHLQHLNTNTAIRHYQKQHQLIIGSSNGCWIKLQTTHGSAVSASANSKLSLLFKFLYAKTRGMLPPQSAFHHSQMQQQQNDDHDNHQHDDNINTAATATRSPSPNPVNDDQMPPTPIPFSSGGAKIASKQEEEKKDKEDEKNTENNNKTSSLSRRSSLAGSRNKTPKVIVEEGFDPLADGNRKSSRSTTPTPETLPADLKPQQQQQQKKEQQPASSPTKVTPQKKKGGKKK